MRTQTKGKRKVSLTLKAFHGRVLAIRSLTVNLKLSMIINELVSPQKHDPPVHLDLFFGLQ